MKNKQRDFATGKYVNLSMPEEVVRQQIEKILHNDYGYSKTQMDINVPVQMGSSTKFCDIAIYESDKKQHIIGLVETKAPKQSSGKSQLESYMSATSTCRWGLLTNGNEEQCAVKDIKSGRITFEPAMTIPKCGHSDISINKFSDLKPASNLKYTFRLINNLLYANTNLARTEKQGAEMVRLIFCKLADEYNIRDSDGCPCFQVGINESDTKFRKKITSLWEETRTSFVGNSIFSDNESIEIDDYSLRLIVSKLQNYSLLNTSRDVVGDAFEIFAERQFAGEKGQFFTPRLVVDMIISLVNPNKKDKILDPACGSGGFLIAAFNHITKGIDSGEHKKRIAESCLHGIDKESDLSKICRAHMSIIGDGKSNIVTADSLKSPAEWNDLARSKLLKNGERRQFDVIITNPPFGSKIKVHHEHVLRNYDLGHKWSPAKGMQEWEKTDAIKETPPQILFIELCVKLLKPGGKLGIVLPDGLLGNPGDEYIRQWIESKAKVLAVVDCPTATFMPHTGTKTSVLILQKFPASDPSQKIFFAIAEDCGHTMRGKQINNPDGSIREDFTAIADNFIHGKTARHLGFYKTQLKGGRVFVPKYYDPRIANKIKKLEGKVDMTSIKKLIDNGTVEIRGASGTAKEENYELDGAVRFVRTSEICDFGIAPKTQKKVSLETYNNFSGQQNLQINDILFVKDGDFRIGETAILTDKEELQILLQGHFFIIRAKKINPFLLLTLLNTEVVKLQIRQRVFSQSTLKTIGNRINELEIPIPVGEKERMEMAVKVQTFILERKILLNNLWDAIKEN